jgi:hypothetical protein
LGSTWAKRSTTLEAPKSGEHDDQTAPSDEAARKPIRAPGEFGR